jgi:hypothetical protein
MLSRPAAELDAGCGWCADRARISRTYYLLIVAAPAEHTTSSRDPVAPEQPIAPMSSAS